ncbi:MAG: hypothetical protein AAGG07_01345 [Planctomycetota bacterium]
MSGCAEPEERVVALRGPLAGLPGANAGGNVALQESASSGVDPTAVPEGGLRREREDGTVELRAVSPRHLMTHVFQTVRDGERDLFVEQVLSERTKKEFRERGFEPALAFDELVRRREDVFKLFARLPYGENTPGALWTRLGERTYRLKATGMAGRGLRWNFMDAVYEDGNWRLRWFGRDG